MSIDKLFLNNDYMDLKSFKNTVSILSSFIVDKEWLAMFKSDLALNSKLEKNIINIINNIGKDLKNSQYYENLLCDLRNETIRLKKDAMKTKDIVERWFKFREAYMYYGLIEVITEGSILSEMVLNKFKSVYNDDYLDIIKKIDKENPSSLTLFSKGKQVSYDDDFINTYLIFKKWQDDQHVFHDNVLFLDYKICWESFMNLAYSRQYLKNVKGYNLLPAYILDSSAILPIDVLSRFYIADLSKILTTIFGGKNVGLSILYANGLNIPKTYALSVNSVLNNLYKDSIDSIDIDCFAVRSSATAEDGEKNSFAGLFETCLDVPKSKIYDAISVVKSSVNSDRVKGYVNHFNTDNPYMSIVLQEFKKPDLSGVWIGSDISSGILEYTEGMGDKLVSGHIIPKKEFWPSDIGIKASNYYVGKACLSIQKKFKLPADLEWCIVDNELIWLQYRCVTKKINISSNHSLKCNYGTPASSGIASGVVVFLETPDDVITTDKPFILLTDYTDPEWVPVILKSSGIVTAEGGFLSHTAIIARELGIPCITGVGYEVIDKLKEYSLIKINGKTGKITGKK